MPVYHKFTHFENKFHRKNCDDEKIKTYIRCNFDERSAMQLANQEEQKVQDSTQKELLSKDTSKEEMKNPT